jgi:hypothetical protein
MTELFRWVLMALQVLAMALCACIIGMMLMEDAFSLPHRQCVEFPTVPLPADPQ